VSRMSSLVSGGRTMRRAWGSTTAVRVAAGVMPSERAASTWPRGTACTPARIVSDMNAAPISLAQQVAGVRVAMNGTVWQLEAQTVVLRLERGEPLAQELAVVLGDE